MSQTESHATKEMGILQSIFGSSPECEEYPGFNDQGKPSCVSRHWISAPGPENNPLMSDKMHNAFYKTRELLEDEKNEGNLLHTWWYLRWIYFSNKGDEYDVKARFTFLRKFLPCSTLQRFISLEQETDLVYTHEGRMVISLDDTIPGDVAFAYVYRDGRKRRDIFHVDKHWLDHPLDLKQMAQVATGLKPTVISIYKPHTRLLSASFSRAYSKPKPTLIPQLKPKKKNLPLKKRKKLEAKK